MKRRSVREGVSYKEKPLFPNQQESISCELFSCFGHELLYLHYTCFYFYFFIIIIFSSAVRFTLGQEKKKGKEKKRDEKAVQIPNFRTLEIQG